MTDAAQPHEAGDDEGGRREPSTGRAPSRQGSAEPGSRLRLALILAPVAVLVVASNVGDALAPTLVDTHPLLLIALNARNRNLVLVSNLLDPLSYYVVGSLRLLVADPPFYLLGWFYGDAAVQWIEGKSPTIGRFARQFEAAFAKAAYPLVFLAPNNYICLFAGSSGMRPVWFLALNVSGTVARLYVLRVFGDIFSSQIDVVLDFIQEYRWWLTGLSVLLVAGSLFTERRQGKGDLEAIAELVEQEPTQPPPGELAEPADRASPGTPSDPPEPPVP